MLIENVVAILKVVNNFSIQRIVFPAGIGVGTYFGVGVGEARPEGPRAG